MSISLAVSSVCSACAARTIGTKVTDPQLHVLIADAVLAHDIANDRVPGQHFLQLPEEARRYVSAGVGRRSARPEDYVLRVHRGRVSAYLTREHAADVKSVAVVVYTREAYLADPDALADAAERNRIEASRATHVVVAVLADASTKPPLTPFRFAANLAGGNKEALAWSADEIRVKAAEVSAYADGWDIVAD